MLRNIAAILALTGSIWLTGCRQGADWMLVFETGTPEPVFESADSQYVAVPFALLHEGVKGVTVPGGSFLRLTDRNGVLADFGPGTYGFGTLRRSFYRHAAAHQPLPEKYMAYIWEQMAHGKPEEQEVSVKATVLRLPGGSGQRDYLLQPRLLEIIYGDSVRFAWEPFGVGTHTLVVREEGGDWSRIIQSSGTSCSVPTGNWKPHNFYRIFLEGGGPSRLVYFAGQAGEVDGP